MAKDAVMINIRLDPETLKRIDQQAKKMEQTIPYFSRNQMLNLLLKKGLEVIEKEQTDGVYKGR
jgi:predicted transcriptional regulator